MVRRSVSLNKEVFMRVLDQSNGDVKLQRLSQCDYDRLRKMQFEFQTPVRVPKVRSRPTIVSVLDRHQHGSYWERVHGKS